MGGRGGWGKSVGRRKREVDGKNNAYVGVYTYVHLCLYAHIYYMCVCVKLSVILAMTS